ncbi:MAG: hypothetical protein ACPG7F_01655, partial [Aggregatilineales bacterium]
ASAFSKNPFSPNSRGRFMGAGFGHIGMKRANSPSSSDCILLMIARCDYSGKQSGSRQYKDSRIAYKNRKTLTNTSCKAHLMTYVIKKVNVFTIQTDTGLAKIKCILATDTVPIGRLYEKSDISDIYHALTGSLRTKIS